ncbi:uncharacterized protein [Diadema setosum]|uniref:uncharacterized protein n=1 Tax=Diadema setosum TaxID=31175 RepID=UPI003B3A7EF7
MLTVTCTIQTADQPNPFVDTYFIYENVTDNPSPVATTSSFNRATPDFETEYLCVGGNYLGNTTATRSFVPGSTTTLPPTTGNGSGSLGAIVGGVIGGLAVIGLIIGLCCFFSRCPESLPSSCLYCCPAACEPICPSACITLETKGR